MESPENFGFESDGYSAIVDHYANAHILSEEEIITDKIDPIISNLVTTVVEKILLEKVLAQLAGPGPMIR